MRSGGESEGVWGKMARSVKRKHESSTDSQSATSRHTNVSKNPARLTRTHKTPTCAGLPVSSHQPRKCLGRPLIHKGTKTLEDPQARG